MMRQLITLFQPGAPASQDAVSANGGAAVLEACAPAEQSAAPPLRSPAGSAAAGSALSPARAELKMAIAELAAAMTDHERLAGPRDTLGALIASVGEQEQKLAESMAADEAILGAWLADGSIGERPSPSIRTQALGRGLVNLRGDARAAERTLPNVSERAQQAVRAVAAAVARRDDALVRAAVEMAREVCDRELVPAVEAVIHIEARLRALVMVLIEAGHRHFNPIRSAPGCAGLIADAIRDAKAKPAVPRDDDGARRFLDRLAADPGARL